MTRITSRVFVLTHCTPSTHLKRRTRKRNVATLVVVERNVLWLRGLMMARVARKTHARDHNLIVLLNGRQAARAELKTCIVCVVWLVREILVRGGGRTCLRIGTRCTCELCGTRGAERAAGGGWLQRGNGALEGDRDFLKVSNRLKKRNKTRK